MAHHPAWKYLYGPVASWRLGRSLGVDVLSQPRKVCNFDCVYCQIGSHTPHVTKRAVFVPTSAVLNEIRGIPSDMAIDFITFSGRGEPTLASNLGDVIKGVRALRSEKIALITNATLLRHKAVRDAVCGVDVVMAKLDVPSNCLLKKINRPAKGIHIEHIVEGIEALQREFAGVLELQIMFVEASRAACDDMCALMQLLKPQEVQINTPLRPSGALPLSKQTIETIRTHFSVLTKKGITVVSVYDAIRKPIVPMHYAATLLRRGKEN